MRFALTILGVVALGACLATTSALSCDASVTPVRGPMLEIQFVESLRIRTCGQDRLRSEVGANVSALEAVLDSIGVRQIQPVFDPDAVAVLLRDAKRLSDEPVADLLSWHRLVFPPGADLQAAIGVLSARPEVAYVYVVDTIPPPPP